MLGLNIPSARYTSDDTVVIARSVPIETELGRRGIHLKRQGRELVGPCPVCGGDDRFAINIKKQVWNVVAATKAATALH
jgi:Zinc-binding domain of primase-helicase